MGDNTAAASGHGEDTTLDKGKGKAPQEDVSMGEEESSSEEESGPEELVDDDEEEPADDKLEPVSTDNIIHGSRRTRGKVDYEAAAKESDEEMDDDEDDDYEAAEEGDDQMRV